MLPGSRTRLQRIPSGIAGNVARASCLTWGRGPATACPVTQTRRLSLAFLSCLVLAVVGCGPKYPNCDDDEDCPEGEYCLNNLCQQCREDVHCATGQQCVDGRCEDVDGYCDDTRPCPAGEECVGNRCQPAQTAAAVSEPPPESGPCSLQTVYFEFDADNLTGSARDAVQANAQCIQERNISSVHVTGHTDPRGTEEYNLALGDRRARSVKRFMTSLGVEESRVSTSSVGEEMASGSDEASWARDRRAAFTER